MNPRKKLWPLGAVHHGAIFLFCMLLAACTIHQPHLQTGGTGGTSSGEAPASRHGKVIWSSGLQFVALKALPATAPTNDQPHSVTANRLRTLLGSLKVKWGAHRVQPVFTHNALGKLAPALSKALSKAQPRQDIVFAVVTQGQPHNARMLLTLPYGKHKQPLITTGLVFYHHKRLNIIFGKMHTPFEAQQINTAKPPKLTPGSRKQRIQTGWAVVGGTQMTHPRPNRPDWVSIAVNASAAPAATRMPKPAPNNSQPTQSKTEGKTEGKTQAKTQAKRQGNATYQSIARRLRILEKLHANGLITDQEYRRKRQKILNNL